MDFKAPHHYYHYYYHCYYVIQSFVKLCFAEYNQITLPQCQIKALFYNCMAAKSQPVLLEFFSTADESELHKLTYDLTT